MDTKVLKFRLSNEKYCIDIHKVDEIVESKELTNIPNSSEEIEGIMDLRGDVTTIINPKKVLDVNEESMGDFIIVFDNKDERKGWIVDEVNDVIDISEENINTNMTEGQKNVDGIISIDNDFFVLVNPVS